MKIRRKTLINTITPLRCNNGSTVITLAGKRRRKEIKM